MRHLPALGGVVIAAGLIAVFMLATSPTSGDAGIPVEPAVSVDDLEVGTIASTEIVNVRRAMSDEGVDVRPATADDDSLARVRKEFVEKVLNVIEGSEEEPAGDVFENIEKLAQVPAGRLLRIMDIGFGRSLGVGCDHCHDTDDWASDDKRPKKATRRMLDMVRTINTELLADIDELESDRPSVNCTTCHRGDVKPALDFPESTD